MPSQEFKFHTLSDKIDSIHQNFGVVWHIHQDGQKVYFFSNPTLFIWEADTMSYIDLDRSYYRSFL
ncbi:MAG: hypothetical protein AAFP19_17345, partial [Bacteroidota bacterium]